MATFYWVGGYTGFTGTNSGYSAGTQLWTSPTGLTSSIGDYYYSPYAWNLKENWLEQFTTSPWSSSLCDNKSADERKRYRPAPRTPRGGDTVVFGTFVGSMTGTGWSYGSLTGVSGNFPIAPGYGAIYYGTCTPTQPGLDGYPVALWRFGERHISCLYGGMSGDGFESSGSTGWFNPGSTAVGSYPLSDLAYGPLAALTVLSTWRVAAHSEYASTTGPSGSTFRAGQIGLPTLPLRLNLTHGSSDNSPIGVFVHPPSYVIGSTYSGTRAISIKNIAPSGCGNAVLNSSLTAGDPVTGTYLRLSGSWNRVIQKSGNLILGGGFGFTANSLQIGGSGTGGAQPINSFLMTEDTIAYATNINVGGVGTTTATNPICVYNIPTSAMPTELKVNGWANQNTTRNYLTIMGDGGLSGMSAGMSASVIDTVILGENGLAPIVRIRSGIINNLKAYSADIGTNKWAYEADNINIRNGFLKEGSIDMNHPNSSVSWQNFNLGGITANDEGLRIDSRKVIVKCYPGQTLLGSAESITGY